MAAARSPAHGHNGAPGSRGPESGSQTLALSATQRKALRGQAHPLQPVVRVGRAGLTDTTCSEVERALAHHELIKIKIAAERDERKRIVAEIQDRIACAVVGAIGQVVILYRPHTDPDERRIRV
ncbi:MAG TPA: ribosome assembly RNA-binding protein YhbY [Thermoanaerobaculia bacterium]|nr:ribosome assembly RNA-binding protein YhbY [Thermoanaerobaculia bacterium]